jgi:hypothetical protein
LDSESIREFSLPVKPKGSFIPESLHFAGKIGFVFGDSPSIIIMIMSTLGLPGSCLEGKGSAGRNRPRRQGPFLTAKIP